MSNRNYLLAKLDDRRNSGKLPWGLGMENNVTVTLSAYNVKIIKDDRTGVSDKLTKPNSQCEIKLAALCLEHFAPHSNPRDCGSQLCQGWWPTFSFLESWWCKKATVSLPCTGLPQTSKQDLELYQYKSYSNCHLIFSQFFPPLGWCGRNLHNTAAGIPIGIYRGNNGAFE